MLPVEFPLCIRPVVRKCVRTHVRVSLLRRTRAWRFPEPVTWLTHFQICVVDISVMRMHTAWTVDASVNQAISVMDITTVHLTFMVSPVN